MTFNERVANIIHARLRDYYKLSISPSMAMGIARQVVNEIAQTNKTVMGDRHHVDAAYKAYFETTGLPVSEYSKHSAFWFSKFLKSNYTVLLLPRDGRLKNIFYKVARFVFKPKH